MTPRIRVVVADDHAIVREGVRLVLETGERFAVVGEASSAAEAIAMAAAQMPDVVILDISMPGGSGLQAVPEILERSPTTRILILSMHDNVQYVVECMRAGAHGYLHKDTAPAELRTAVETVAQGDAYFSPEVTAQVAAALRGASIATGAGSVSPGTLTPRERQVLTGVARGLANKEIAAQLGISTRTVEAHRDSLGKKLGIRTAAGLTRYALEQGVGEG
jgi:two-component system, NarL family, nitrate/nitrite response regulator NarL